MRTKEEKLSVSNSSVTVYGAAYSVYVRIVRIALGEKGVSYTLVPVDVFADDGLPPDYLSRQPFGRIPAFEHDGFCLYETSAITRYIDEAFSGPSLQPPTLHQRARMNQILAMLDNYGYVPMVWDVYVQRLEREAVDEARIVAGLAKARIFMKALSTLIGTNHFLTGGDFSLADCHLAPMLDLFAKAPDGADLLCEFATIRDWWERVKSRPSVLAATTA